MATDKTKEANWAIARARWEGEPRCSYSDLTDFLGISKQAISKRSNKEKWQKKLSMSNIVDKAHAAADRKITKDAKDAASTAKGKTSVDARQKPGATLAALDAPTAPVIPASLPDSKNPTPEMLAQAVEDVAIDARAVLLTRHRNEWPAVRNQAYKAIKANDLDGAKLAKIAGETIKLIQDGERKAWGLDAGGDEDKLTRIIIERTEGVRVVR